MNLATFTKMIELVVTLISIITVTYVIPYIHSKYDASELDKLKQYIEFGVRCAEMYFDTQDGKIKKDYVLNYVKGVIGELVHTDITDEQLDIMIESVVNTVKYGYVLK